MLDLRYAARTLTRSPAFALAAIATLALGIGATTAIWSVVHRVLLRDLPYRDPDRIVVLWENDHIRGTEREYASYPDYEDLLAQSRSYAALAGAQQRNRTITGHGEEAERVVVLQVNPAWFQVLGIDAALGRTFDAEDSRPHAPGVAVVSRSFWQSRLGGDPSAVGRALRIDGAPHAIVGVVPDDTALPGSDAEVWVPLAPGLPATSVRGMHNVFVVGRLADGATRESAQVEASAIMARLEAAYPEDNEGRGAVVADLHAELVGDARAPLLTLLGAVGAVLLIACVNVANLLLARGTTRERELALRSALGGGRGRLGLLLWSECLVLGAAGGAAGVALAYFGLDALRGIAPAGVPGLADATVDGAALAGSAALSLGCVVLFGLAPALRGARIDPARSLEGGTRAGSGRGAHRARHLLVATEAALSVVLVVAAALLLRSFAEMRAVDPGYNADRLLTLRLELPEATYPPPQSWPWHEWPRATQFHEELLARVRALPGVQSAGLALNGPGMGGWTTRVVVEGRPEPSPAQQDESTYSPVSADYLQTMGVPLRRGRMLSPADRRGAPFVVVVNEAFARRHFPAEDPIGQHIRFFGTPHEVVGVVGDVRSGGLLATSRPTFYPALAQNPWGQLSLTVRVSGDPHAGRPGALEPALRAAVRDLDRDVAVFGVAPVSELLAGSIAQQRFTALLLAVFALLALALAAVGIYGVVAFSLAQRAREIGIRMALGADRGRVLRATMARGVGASAAGIAFGLLVSLGAGRLLRAQLYGISATDPAIYAAVAVALCCIAILAVYLPARQATRIAPAEALRHE